MYNKATEDQGWLDVHLYISGGMYTRTSVEWFGAMSKLRKKKVKSSSNLNTNRRIFFRTTLLTNSKNTDQSIYSSTQLPSYLT